VGFLVGTSIGSDRTAKRGCERLAAMAAIGAGIGDNADLDGGQSPVAFGAKLHMHAHRMARRSANELLLARELPHHRPTGFQRCEQTEILGDHFLLAAKTAADPLGEDMEVAIEQAEEITKLL